ncbi:MAG: AbrB/MazE/SpoVT family DNA-binding domain-containing protein [Nitrososphaerales archaeon]|nr:AbrB/MazE/SpoVT family DNA-binding domain-containing protein [Nitrososphaerales archaeon]
MTETATVTSKSMVNIPASIRKKYGIKEGDKVAFVESDRGLLLLRVPPLNELFGSGRIHRNKLIHAVRELEAEHRREVAE